MITGGFRPKIGDIGLLIIDGDHSFEGKLRDTGGVLDAGTYTRFFGNG